TVTATLANNYDSHPTFTADDLQDLGSVTVVAADQDGDSATGTVSLAVSDDVPVLTEPHTDIILTGDDLSGSGVFDYSIGADNRTTFSSLNTDFTIVLSGSVGSTAIVNPDVEWVSEDASEAVFDFTFEYDANPTDPNNPLSIGSGTITFDKDAGTYEVTLDAPVESYSISQTSATVSRADYNLTGPASQSEYSVSQIGATDPIFVRFVGIEAADAFNSLGTDTTFTSGDTFQGDLSYVTISGNTNGVSGDTIQGQGGEVLNLDFFTSDPGTVDEPAGLTADPNDYATGVTLKMDLVGANTDFIVILKLADPNDPSLTITETVAIVVDAEDIYRQGDTIPAGYTTTLDSNDGLVIIESNDYNLAGEGLVIVGLQLVPSSEGTSGTGIDLNRATGDTGLSTSSDTFAGHDDNDVVKITDIGLIRTVTNTEALHLDFDVTITDVDGDATAVTTLSVNPITPPLAMDLDGDGVEFVGLEAGVTHDYGSGLVTTAWVAADDGLLARDTGTGLDVVFADDAAGATTDIEGLRLAYDSNGDGVLDSADTAWGEFGVWQDADQDGVTDEGEFVSLSEAGIASIDLVTDGEGYVAGDGDVTVFGTGSYTRMDGSTGVLADAAFATAPADRRTAEVTLTTAAATGLLVPELAAANDTQSTAEQPLSKVQFADLDATATTLAPANDLGTDPAKLAYLFGAPKVASNEADAAMNPDPASEPTKSGLPDIQAHTASFDLEVSSSEPVAEFSISGGRLAGDADASLMEALLTLAAPADQGAEKQDLDLVKEAFAEVSGEAVVDSIVDHFADGSAADLAVPSHVEVAGVLHEALDAPVFFGGAAGQATDAVDDAAQLAAAVHA
ncbi:MAG: hypothetical protein ACO1OD_04270, partial [Croceibacterium sp.]